MPCRRCCRACPTLPVRGESAVRLTAFGGSGHAEARAVEGATSMPRVIVAAGCSLLQRSEVAGWFIVPH
eukprot:6186253-Pleurochrysis_carterae.AAC.7